MSERFPETIVYKDTKWRDVSVMTRPKFRRRRCCVMVEISDKTITTVDLYKMIDAGMNVVKLMSALSSEHDRAIILARIDKAAATCAGRHNIGYWPVASICPLKTSSVRTGNLKYPQVPCIVTEGAEIIITKDEKQYNNCDSDFIFVDNPYLIDEVKVGTEINMDEGALSMKCTEIIDKMSIKAVVVQGGELHNTVIVSMRGVVIKRPLMAKRDGAILKFVCVNQLDAVILYYVRQVETVRKARLYLSKCPKKPIVISAVCTLQGLLNVDAVLSESDALIMAREFLSYELPAALRYRLPRIQKWIIGKCLQAGKPIYLSGEILKRVNMYGEVTGNQIMNVADAVLDGVSGFLITGGINVDNLLLSISLINDICCDIEPQLNAKLNSRRVIDHVRLPLNAAEAAVFACCLVVLQTKARIIIIPTVTGITARLMSRFQPQCLIMAVCSNETVARQLCIFRSVFPLQYVSPSNVHGNTEDRIQYALEYAVKRSWVVFGDLYVTLQRGSDLSCYCDMLRVWPVNITNRPMVICEDDDDNLNRDTDTIAESYISRQSSQ